MLESIAPFSREIFRGRLDQFIETNILLPPGDFAIYLLNDFIVNEIEDLLILLYLPRLISLQPQSQLILDILWVSRRELQLE
jgi:hypothetical protein